MLVAIGATDIINAQEIPLPLLSPQVESIINAPEVPNVRISPTGDYLFLAERDRYQSLAELKRPQIRVAGLRIEPDTYSRHGQLYWNSLKIKKITLADCCQSAIQEVPLPPNAQITLPIISADGKRFAFLLKRSDGLQVWAGETAMAKARPVAHLRVNTLFDSFEDEDPAEDDEAEFFNLPLQWMPDQVHILVKAVVAPNVTMPAKLAGDNVLLARHSDALNRVMTPDALKDDADAVLFERYALSQPTLANVVTGQLTAIGPPAIWESLMPSPDGQYFFARRYLRSYLTGVSHVNFPLASEVWKTDAQLIKQMWARGPLQELSPTSVRYGPRGFSWRQTAPATLVWAEALDAPTKNGRRVNTPRDQILMQAAPFNGKPQYISSLAAHFSDIKWSAKDGLAFLYDDEGRMFGIYPDQPQRKPELLWDEPCNDALCRVVMQQQADGTNVVVHNGTAIYLAGTSTVDYQSRSYLKRFDLGTHQRDLLFEDNGKAMESFQGLLTPDARYILTRRESSNEPPNYYVRALGDGSHAGNTLRPVTDFPDFVPPLRQVQRQFVSYKRSDGVNLSFVLYLPVNYKPGTRLPTVLSVYPKDYDVGVSPPLDANPVNQYLDFTGISPLFFTLRGYAVLEQVTMPVIGPDTNRNDSFIEQINWDAKAAIDKAVKMGVADPERIGVIGHSYGAFAAANLLAHTDWFRAGIASSGAYNRTLTPYGFQHEKRWYWEAREFYHNVSPFTFVKQLKEPLLLLHGAEDENGGTAPLQSKGMADALSSTGGTTELFLVPHEGHQYKARESVAQSLALMFAWFDKYVKNAAPRPNSKTKAKEK